MQTVEEGQEANAAASYLADLRARGIQLRANGDALVVEAARDALNAADRDRIRAMKPALLGLLADTPPRGGGVRIPRAPRGGALPLGLVQQRMWLLDQLDPESTANNLPGAWRLRGPLDPDAFQAAIRAIVSRHEILRTRIAVVDGEPRQVVEPDVSIDVPVIDLRSIHASARDGAMMADIRAQRDTPFDLTRAPLLRARLFRVEEEEHVFFLLPHHVVWDGWSWDIFHAELSAIYGALRRAEAPDLEPLAVQYADYAAWHRALMDGPELERQVGYWKRQLGTPLPELELPADFTRPALLDQRGDRRLIDLDRDLTAQLWRIGREENATLFMVLLAAYVAWLFRVTGQDDVTVGVPTQDRLEAGADRLIGPFVNTLVIRARPRGNATFRELLREVRDASIEAYDHQDVPFERLVDALGIARSTSRTPLYQTLFTYQDVTRRPTHIGDLAMSQVHVDTGAAPTDLLFGCMIGSETSVALLDFNVQLFAPATMTRLARSMEALLRDVGAAPQRSIDQLDIVAHERTAARAGGTTELFRTAGSPVSGASDDPTDAQPRSNAADAGIAHAAPAAMATSATRAAGEFVAPRNDVESRVAALWQSLLGVERVGSNDNFFELGGHSLLAIRMLSRLGEMLPDARASFRGLVENPALGAFCDAAFESPTRATAAPASLTVPGELMPTHGQEAIWFLERMAGPDSTAYHLIETLQVDGVVDVDALRRALRAAVARHDALRQRFFEREGVLRVDLRDVYDPLVLHDMDGAEAIAIEAALGFFARKPFDLDADPMLRVHLVRTGSASSVLQFIVHHIVMGGPSLNAVIREVAEDYSAIVRGQPAPTRAPAVSFSALAAHMRASAGEGAWDDQLEYWRRIFETPVAPLALGGGRRSDPLSTAPGGTVTLELPADVVAAVNRLAARESTTQFVVVMTALQILLARCADQDEVVIGVPVRAVPDVPGAEDVAGLFLNTVVCRASLADEPTVTQLVARNRATVVEAWDNRDYPFSKIVEQLHPDRSSRNPLFQVILSFQNDDETGAAFEGLRTSVRHIDRGGTQAELAFYVTWRGASATIHVDFGTDRFERAEVTRLAGRLTGVLRDMAADPSARILDCSVVDANERTRLLALAAGPQREVAAASVVEWIARHSSRDAVAVGGAGRDISYVELWSESAAIARALIEDGVRAGESVGVCLSRSPDAVVALLAVWRAGAAYVPLDADFPEERLAFMAEDAGCRRVVVDGETAGLFDAQLEVDVRELAGAGATAELPASIDAEHVAYRIYTSGSTGRPKGVEVEHGNLANFIQSMSAEPGIRAEDVLVSVTTVSFDIAGLEMWLPLCAGARVVIATGDEVRDGALLEARLERCGCTILQATPTTWRMLLDAGWSWPLRKALCGGEAFPAELAEPLSARADEVWNLYGPTETTIWSTAHRVSGAGDAVPIGRPIDNTLVYIVDRHGRLSPEGSAGELWIGGAGVARGYRGRPELTAERFRPDPFGAHGRAYRTGDLVRWRADATLEHLGRMDDQVKVNGHRIELGEIEAVLAAHDGVRQAVAAIKTGNDGSARLVAYVVWEPGRTLLASELRRFMRRRLPDYMVPGLVVELDEVPLTANGKVDRARLPNPLAVAHAREYVAPATATQIAIAEIWQGLLNRDRVGMHDNFFELGGHSLLSIRAVAALEERAGVRLDPRSLFFQTLEQVAEGAERAMATFSAAR